MIFKSISNVILQKANILSNTQVLLNTNKNHKIFLNTIMEKDLHKNFGFKKITKMAGKTNMITYFTKALKNQLKTTQSNVKSFFLLQQSTNYRFEQNYNTLAYSKYNNNKGIWYIPKSKKLIIKNKMPLFTASILTNFFAKQITPIIKSKNEIFNKNINTGFSIFINNILAFYNDGLLGLKIILTGK